MNADPLSECANFHCTPRAADSFFRHGVTSKALFKSFLERLSSSNAFISPAQSFLPFYDLLAMHMYVLSANIFSLSLFIDS